jgi:flagellar assembly protein FliH
LYDRIVKSHLINNLNTPYKIIPVFKKPEIVEQRVETGEENEGNEDRFEELTKKTIKEMLDEAKENAGLIVEEANLEAKKILENAKIESENLKTQAFENAYSEGFKQASKDAEDKYYQMIEEANKIKELAEEDYEKTIINAEKEIVSLAVAVARKIIGIEVNTNSQVIISLVKEALKRTNEKDNVTIKVSSDDFLVLNDNLNSIIGRETGLTDVDIRQNAGLERGDVIIETSFGVIDGSAEKKLSIVEEALQEFVLENEE